ncbi:hypothetical protein [Dyella sp. C9]|uniref:hypothetical protein n=1 Tax=Dyella sp. C9 TaxID=2202154 RepID=UPI00130034E3|nr:hypothetical protein [Dyella sp. C9]
MFVSPSGALTEDAIKTSVANAKVGHVKFDAGRWSNNARTAPGNDVAVLVDPNDGSVA